MILRPLMTPQTPVAVFPLLSSLCTFFSSSLVPDIKAFFFFFLEESLYIRSSPGIVIGETQYSPGRFNILHTEVDIICYTVCEAIEVLHVKTTHSPVLFSFSVKDNIQWFPLAF